MSSDSERNSGHLSNEDWLILAEGGGSIEARRHLDGCALCAAELDQLRDALAGYQRAAREAGEQTESFWLRQRAAIISRADGTRAAPRLAWAASVAALILGAALLGRQAPPVPTLQSEQVTAPGNVAPPSSAPSDSSADSVLLLEVHQSVQRQVPEALEPAVLLVDAMNQNASERRNP